MKIRVTKKISIRVMSSFAPKSLLGFSWDSVEIGLTVVLDLSFNEFIKRNAF